MSATNQEFADNYIHHNSEPLGLRQAQAVDAGHTAPVPQPTAETPLPTVGSEPSATNMSDATRYAPEATVPTLTHGHGVTNMPHHNMSPEAQSAFNEILFPRDSYTENGTYWADLPLGEKLRFINNQSNAEARRELGVIGRMIKKDPLSVIRAYFGTYVINGLGMFVEGYTLFSVGNLKPMFAATDHAGPNGKGTHTSQFYRCWNKPDPKKGDTWKQICDKNWQNAIDYLEIVGIICGQILVGIEGDWVGRKFGMVQDALIMTLGSVMLTAMWGTTFNGWVICYAWSLFIYGLGVGGEYPMTSTRAMESHSNRYSVTTGDRMHRGRNVLLAFLMQGWGQFVNQTLLILLLLIFNNSLNTPIKPAAAQYTFRVSFGIIAGVTLFLAYYRYYKITYSESALRDAKERLNTSGYDLKSLKLAMGHYWHRLLASTSGWFFNDFFFYGNKIFSGVFIKLITGPGGTFSTTWLYNLINVGVQLPGYYMAALLVDHKLYGRKWMQGISFAATFALFCAAAFSYHTLTTTGPGNLKVFQFIFFFSSFWNQFGYNSTTFLVAAEIFPASIRATCHGFSAAWGKLGALVPTIIYNYIDNQTKFYVVTWFGLAGIIVTFVFLPDTTGLDLREQERYWEYVMSGRPEDYHGVAVHPRHLSLWERLVLKRHLAYNPQLDAQQKTEEFHQVYNSTMAIESHADHDLTMEQRDFLESEFGNKYVKDVKMNRPNQIYSSKLESLEKQL
ncbi:transmembrane transporter [Malassezia pachydermatis]|uniref:Mfs phosphate n=1 Tax=Malassezia pachydermatis TaxID=77020 RepID=A0A0M8MM58_9BASI|nr:mfs phosphate [Malassezia pachydermatis]KOS15276.1 mfs phosphate [Malassezia pachydermatis]